MVNKDTDFDFVPPSAGSMIESLRAYGYSPGTAVADLIDNSISAGAKKVSIVFHWAGAESKVIILDDGFGMDEETLRNAMRPGSHNPLAPRAESDLGRFGLGLKTASFSQCRRLTVASRVLAGNIHIRCWDLDYVQEVNDWRLLKSPTPASEGFIASLQNLNHGTIVLWEKVDRLVDNDCNSADAKAQEMFHNTVMAVKQYIAMVFHRLLRSNRHQDGLDILINGDSEENRIQPWDPFLVQHPSTQKSPPEPLRHPYGDVIVKGFVLPHKDRMTPAEAEFAAGIGGWGARQGFYVYRNRRLLVPGSWLGLGDGRPWAKEEQYKLARIRVDIPNSADLAWQIDVKKSTAHPPTLLRNRLYELASKVRRDARDVFVHRGASKPRSTSAEFIRVWMPKNVKKQQAYYIDRTHPLVQAVTDLLPADEQQPFKALLRLLEETIPVGRIWLDIAEGADVQATPFETADDKEKKRMVVLMYRLLRKNRGLSHDGAKTQLFIMEGFDGMGQYIKDLTEFD